MDWRIELVQAGQLEQHEYKGKAWETAIYKRALAGPVQVTPLGIAGDQHTGGTFDPDRAVCVHPVATYEYWRAYFRRDIPLGFFGENLTVSGLLDEQVCVGDIVRCGSALLQVTQPRTPCHKPADKLGEPALLKLTLQTGKLGFLLRVLEPGTLQAGDAFELIERPHPTANLVFVNRIRYQPDNHAAAAELAALDALAYLWQLHFAARSAPHEEAIAAY
ncbi:MAG: MOSC domain-containing protein [Roseiflexaceae bacterium]|nr:MOSC domain-containing protein [Roseiflexaceae bacterium]